MPVKNGDKSPHYEPNGDKSPRYEPNGDESPHYEPKLTFYAILMSYKTDRLVNLFPDAYAAEDPESLLYKLLDAIAAELMVADEKIKQLLKSHWVDYASGEALDGLGASYGVSRRQLRDGTREIDDAFRQRLKSIVPLFTGGGTRPAIIGAVRSALGLPFDLDQLKLPPGFEVLREDIEKLVYIEEFSPKGERVVNKVVTEKDKASELILVIDIPTVQEERPTIHWKFNRGGGRLLSLERLPEADGAGSEGIRSKESLIVPPGQTLTLSTDAEGSLSAVIGLIDVSDQFTDLEEARSPEMPEVPVGRSEWRFRAQSCLFDISAFDGSDTFDLPEFEVEMNWLRYEPLTFDVHVPYFLQEAVDGLKKFHKYQGKLFVYEGLPLESIADVVNQTRAAGVRGSVQFSLNFLETHDQDEKFTLHALHSFVEDAGVSEDLATRSDSQLSEHHDTDESFIIGNIFDVSTFDQGYGFVE